MNTPIKLEQFEGPLDLLLQLIEAEELPLSEISLSQVTDQFMRSVEELEDKRPDDVADFLVLATKLLYLKVRLLLPHLAAPEDQDENNLARQLKLYKEFQDASKVLNKLWLEGLVGYGRLEPPRKTTEFVVPKNATAAHLEKTFQALLKRLKPINPLPQVAIGTTVSLHEKIANLTELLGNLKRLRLSQIVGEGNRAEVVVSFLAVLELMRSNRIVVVQETCYADVEMVLR